MRIRCADLPKMTSGVVEISWLASGIEPANPTLDSLHGSGGGRVRHTRCNERVTTRGTPVARHAEHGKAITQARRGSRKSKPIESLICRFRGTNPADDKAQPRSGALPARKTNCLLIATRSSSFFIAPLRPFPLAFFPFFFSFSCLFFFDAGSKSTCSSEQRGSKTRLGRARQGGNVR